MSQADEHKGHSYEMTDGIARTLYDVYCHRAGLSCPEPDPDGCQYEDVSECDHPYESYLYEMEYRPDWIAFGTSLDSIPDSHGRQYRLLLAGGGPAVRMRISVSSGRVQDAWLEYNDWWSPWIRYVPEWRVPLRDIAADILLDCGL